MNPLNRKIPEGTKPASVAALESEVASQAAGSPAPSEFETARPKVLGQGAMTKGGDFVNWDALMPTMRKADPSSYDPAEAPDPRAALAMPTSPQAIAAALQAQGTDLTAWGLAKSGAARVVKRVSPYGTRVVKNPRAGGIQTAHEEGAPSRHGVVSTSGFMSRRDAVAANMVGKLEVPARHRRPAGGAAQHIEGAVRSVQRRMGWGNTAGHGLRVPTTEQGRRRMDPGSLPKELPKEQMTPGKPAGGSGREGSKEKKGGPRKSSPTTMTGKMRRKVMRAAMTGKVGPGSRGTHGRSGVAGPGATGPGGHNQPPMTRHTTSSGRTTDKDMETGASMSYGGGQPYSSQRPSRGWGSGSAQMTGKMAETVGRAKMYAKKAKAEREARRSTRGGYAYAGAPWAMARSADAIDGLEDLVKMTMMPEEKAAALLSKGGPYTGPRGGKWADPQHKIPWSPEGSKDDKRAHHRTRAIHHRAHADEIEKRLWDRAHARSRKEAQAAWDAKHKGKDPKGSKGFLGMGKHPPRPTRGEHSAELRKKKFKADRKLHEALKHHQKMEAAHHEAKGGLADTPWDVSSGRVYRVRDVRKDLKKLSDAELSKASHGNSLMGKQGRGTVAGHMSAKMAERPYTGAGKRTGTPGHYEYEYGGSKGGQKGKHGETDIPEYKITVRGKSHEEIAQKIKSGIDKAADLCKTDPPVCAGNLGIVRTWMPQFNDDPKKGGDKNAIKNFLAEFKAEGKGVKSQKADGSPFTRPVGTLKATQREIKTAKSYGMASAQKKYEESKARGDGGFYDAVFDGKKVRTDWHPSKNAIVVSKDGYVLDGHHRYAAMVIADPGFQMPVHEVDATIEEILDKTQEWFEQGKAIKKADFQGKPVSPKDQVGKTPPWSKAMRAAGLGGKKKTTKKSMEHDQMINLHKGDIPEPPPLPGRRSRVPPPQRPAPTGRMSAKMSAKMKKRQAWRDYVGDFVGKCGDDVPQPKRLRRSMDGALEMDLRKGGLYSFNDSHAKNRSSLPAKLLPEYLAAFVEEAYEHERKECEHRKIAPLADEDHAEFWAKRVLGELVVYMRMNKDLARAGKGQTVKTIASVLRSRGIVKPSHKTTTPTDRDSAVAMNARIDGQNAEVLAFSEVKRGHFREELEKAGASLELSGWRGVPEIEVIDDKVDPFAAGARTEAARVGRMGAMSKGFVARASVNHECVIHGFRDLTKSQNLANPDGHCICG